MSPEMACHGRLYQDGGTIIIHTAHHWVGNYYTVSLTIPLNAHHRHENGSVKFWDVTSGKYPMILVQQYVFTVLSYSVGMALIYELKTRILFVGMEDDTDISQSEYSWPPYRRVGKFDPFGDDPRLAIQLIKFCQLTQTLCVGGAGGQVITFSLNSTQNEVRLEVCISIYIVLCE